jgi:predicted ATPase
MVIFFNCKDTFNFTLLSFIFYHLFYYKNIANLNPKKVVIAGGPGTGKTSLINHLKTSGFLCYDEISRQVTLQARKDGIAQLFLTEPLLFSEKLLEGRTQQFLQAAKESENIVFLDRGIPDVLAYMDHIGDAYPEHFVEACEKYKYDFIFILSPWQEIFTSDSERYESYEEAIEIHHHLLDTYKRFGYQLIDVPFGSLKNRSDFILESLNLQ